MNNSEPVMLELGDGKTTCCVFDSLESFHSLWLSSVWDADISYSELEAMYSTSDAGRLGIVDVRNLNLCMLSPVDLTGVTEISVAEMKGEWVSFRERQKMLDRAVEMVLALQGGDVSSVYAELNARYANSEPVNAGSHTRIINDLFEMMMFYSKLRLRDSEVKKFKSSVVSDSDS
jgi:hypothetical protein